MNIKLSQIETADLLEWKERIEKELSIREKQQVPALVSDAIQTTRAYNTLVRYCHEKSISFKTFRVEDVARLSFKELRVYTGRITKNAINNMLRDHGFDPLED